MGLDISGAVSKKDYHANYGALHLVRWMALIYCGLPREICGDSSFGWTNGPWLHGYVMAGKELPSKEQMSTILWAFKRVGREFPNLMFHSDCDGSYTKTGRVLKTTELLTGNSVGLLKELEMLKEDLHTYEKDSRAVAIFNMLYELVYDEVKNGKGHLKFH